MVDTAPGSTSGVPIHSIIGGVVGGILGFCLVVGAFLFYRRRSRKTRAAERSKLESIVAGGAYKFQDTHRDSDRDHIPLSLISEGGHSGRNY